MAQFSVLGNGELLHITSSVLNEERPILVHLPDTYNKEGEGYPVLIVLDAEWSFRTAVAISEHLASGERAPSMIIVGIPNVMRSGRPSRFVDLAPAFAPDGQPDSSDGSQSFMRFIVEEVLPFVETSYHTAPHRVIAGHSLGGLFVVYSMLEDQDAFDAFIAISPSLGRNNQQQIKRASELFTRTSTFPEAFYFSIGDEGGNTKLGSEALAKVLSDLPVERFRWKYEPYREENHVSVVHQSLYSALEWIYEGWRVPDALLTDNDISVVHKHYEDLSKRLGYEIKTPQNYYSQLGYRILAEHEFDYASWTFGQYHEAYPSAAGALVGMGDVSLMQGQVEEAVSFYKRALKINPRDERAGLMIGALE